jgi:hypothetical protein
MRIPSDQNCTQSVKNRGHAGAVGPRTELSELTGMDRTALHWWLQLMTEEGLLRCEKVSRHHVYHWNHPDA